MPTIGQLLAEARPLLAATPFGASTREARLLLGHVLGLSEGKVLAREEMAVPPEAERRFRDLLARRLAGEPVSYLTGEREFWGRPFAVDSRVLIPRPETEHLVEVALELRLPEAPWILDVGTGSGILAVTLALEIPGSRAVAVDLSPGALAVAARNAHRLGAADRISFLGADLTAALDLRRFDLVVSNPPYVDRSEIPEISLEVLRFRAPPGALSARRRRCDPGAALRSVHGPALREYHWRSKSDADSSTPCAGTPRTPGWTSPRFGRTMPASRAPCCCGAARAL